MDDQQKLQQMVSELSAYRNQAELLQQQVEAIQASLAELEVLKTTIDDMAGKGSAESLVPIGGGAFMEGEITNTDYVVMSIGAGIAVKQTVDEAKVTIDSQSEELKENLDNTLKSLQQVTDVIAQLQPAAEKLSKNLQLDAQLSGQ
ncbi:prefoldin subunit alpha [uncultured Methanobrevibacter sp.]|uniref:prefoldin subunit alpha n=1 Tax=uncultured Methanobrevibacter sp. TaxID=253161 RepID=UPI0025DA0DC8|nr:prefoldin subunit alpha [uncultured Methanobrevibacter sp.]